MKPGNRFIRFASLPAAEKRLLLLAVYWLAIARILLLVVSFRRLTTWLEKDLVRNTAFDPDLQQAIGNAVQTAARNVPWRANCFPQAIAALKLLKHHEIRCILHIGVAKDKTGAMEGHAWISCGGSIVTGGPDISHYTELFRLPEDIRAYTKPKQRPCE